MIKDTKSQSAKEGNQILELILDLNKLPQVNTKMHTQSMDDIIIFSWIVEEHLNHIKQVFEKLRNAHLSMKHSKCNFFTKEIQYLGHILSTTGMRPLPLKTQAIKTMHPPKTPKQLCAFLRLIRYYRKFIRNFTKIARSLTVIT